MGEGNEASNLIWTRDRGLEKHPRVYRQFLALLPTLGAGIFLSLSSSKWIHHLRSISYMMRAWARPTTTTICLGRRSTRTLRGEEQRDKSMLLNMIALRSQYLLRGRPTKWTCSASWPKTLSFHSR